MFVAYFAQALQIPLGRNQHARRSGDGLDNNRCDGRGVVQDDQTFQVVGKVDAPTRLPLCESVLFQIVGVGQMVHTIEQRTKEFPVWRNAADRDAAKAHAVIATLPPDQARARTLATHPVIGQGNLERRVHRLRPGVAEKCVVDVPGQYCRQA